MSKPLYEPSAWQSLYHSVEGVDELLGAGSAGPGKSFCLLMDCTERIVQEHQRCAYEQHPYHQPWGHSTGWALHLRREYSSLKQTLSRAQLVFRAFDPGVKWSSEDHMFTFTSGYKYQFGHCQHRDDYVSYMSNQYDWIGFDEMNEFLEEQYINIISRKRSSDPLLERQCKVRGMSNPVLQMHGAKFTVDDPYWVRRRFVDPCRDGNKKIVRKIKMEDGTVERHVRMYLPAKLRDNPDPLFRRSYEKTLRSLPKHLKQALLDGDWYLVAGAFYSEWWDAARHVCTPFEVPAEWKIYRSLDWGFKVSGACHWWAVDPDDTAYVIYELTFRGQLVKSVANTIRQVEQGLQVWSGGERGRSMITGFADTQLWEQRGDSGKSKAAEFAQYGVGWRPADKRSRRRNAERLSTRLKETGPGGIVFFCTCKMAIRTIPAIPTSPIISDEPMDGNEDHWHDSILYGCAACSRGYDGIAAVADKDDFEEEPKEDRGRESRFGYG